MGLFDKFFNAKPPVVEPEPVPKARKPRAPRKPKAPEVVARSAKEIATENGEPYVAILSVEVDPENIGNGAFELDWNDKFLAQLVRSGYQGKPNEEESVIVDRWFQDVCRNVLLETFEQEQADPEQRNNKRKDLGGGRSEIS
jgi:hypothetical protein